MVSEEGLLQIFPEVRPCTWASSADNAKYVFLGVMRNMLKSERKFQFKKKKVLYNVSYFWYYDTWIRMTLLSVYK